MWQQQRHTVEVIKENYAALINQDLQSDILPASINMPTLLLGKSCAFKTKQKKQKSDKESMWNTYIIYFTKYSR